MTDITTIKNMLNSQAQRVCEYLLPAGKKQRDEWRIGSVAGENGQSLAVHLSGVKTGVWADFGTGEGGDLIALWQSVRRCNLPDALQEIRGWLGIRSMEDGRIKRKEFTRPEKPKCRAPQAAVLDYLTVNRCISPQVLQVFQVGEDGDFIIFPFKNPEGDLLLAKRRGAVDKAVDREKAKPMPTAKDCEPILFGWQAVPENAREVIICEGEIDALSWATYGFTAMSVPFGGGGGGKQNWIESDYERLLRFEKIYVAMDMDEEGEKAAVEIMDRLGRHRCYRVSLPMKDANDCLVGDVTAEVMGRCLAEAKSYSPDGLKSPLDFLPQVIELFYPTDGRKVGYTLPYEKLKDKLHFRPAEMTLWTGMSGDGKSQTLSDTIPHWIDHGARICICSLEMKATETLRRLVKQTGNVATPTTEYLTAIIEWLSQGLWLYDRLGKEGLAGVLAVFDYARNRYGCDTFIIDSLMRLNVRSTDYEAQEALAFEIVEWAISRNVHVHLVAHSRKAGKDGGVPETQDVKGAMEIGANAANIIGIWRNRQLEEKNKEAEANGDPISEAAPVLINIAKQRNGDFEGKAGLWFNQDTYQYRSSHCPKEGRSYVQYSNQR